MFMNFHKELKEKLKSDYQIQKAVSNKEYFKIENGLYSDAEFVNPLEIICKKYPEAVFTADSATLIINSKEQIICEKIKSLLRFGICTH